MFPQENWYDRDIYNTTSDGGDVYTKDADFLKSCLIYTCLSNQNKCLTFEGSDGRHYQNELCFDDGTPMSSNETKAWILGLSENCDTNRQNIDVIKSNISNVINESMSRFEDALQILENYIKSSHGIDKLRYETVLAYIFAKNKRTELALGIIQEILKTLADNRLAEWNTDIATEIYSYSFDVFKLCEKIDSAQMVLTKLAKISPTIAVTKSYVDE